MGSKLYVNGTILTMEQPLAVEALLVQDGKIVFAGSEREAHRLAGWDYDLIDLHGHTLMPAFIDAHSHFSGYASAQLQVSLSGAQNFEEIVSRIQQFIAENQIAPGKWVQARGYDHNQFKEHRHPDCKVLDRAAPDNPLVIQHQSGHAGVFNTMALKELGITSRTVSPSGGFIAMENGEPTGYMEENAFVSLVQTLPMPSMEDFQKAFATAQQKYLSYGITTAQDGMVVPSLVPLIDMLIQSKFLDIDLVGYLDLKNEADMVHHFSHCLKQYDRRFKIGGYKIFLDGSPQNRTAWMLSPYQSSESNECGTPIYTDDEVQSFVTRALRDDLQLLAHCNGDAANIQFIRACQAAAPSPDVLKKIRPVLVHAQLLPPSSLPEVRQLHMIPSFFVAHVYHWGDVHVQNLGQERAQRISPAAAALREGIPFTFHQDAPIIEPDMLETVWCAVNRVTRTGKVLGKEQQISVLDALKALTVNAAYQYFEENLKGSLSPGKLADLVILDQNPLELDPMLLKNIRVMETIKEGKTVYHR